MVNGAINLILPRQAKRLAANFGIDSALFTNLSANIGGSFNTSTGAVAETFGGTDTVSPVLIGVMDGAVFVPIINIDMHSLCRRLNLTDFGPLVCEELYAHNITGVSVNVDGVDIYDPGKVEDEV